MAVSSQMRLIVSRAATLARARSGLLAALLLLGCDEKAPNAEVDDAGDAAPDATSRDAAPPPEDATRNADARAALPDAHAGDASPQDAALDARLPEDAAAGTPRTLADTGLYADSDQEILAEGVRRYHPRFELWSDGAEKRRWLKLPEGETIDTSDMDYWRFPIGTKVWKEFANPNGKRLETRMLHKKAEGLFGWETIAFAWDATQTRAVATPDGAENVLGTQHDIPSQQQCLECHAGQPDLLLGVSALQLAHSPAGTEGPVDAGEITLSALMSENLLSHPPRDATFELPGSDETTRHALGTLHANCGHCHNPRGSADKVDLDTWLRVDALNAVSDTPTYRTTVNVVAEIEKPELGEPGSKLIEPGAPDASVLYKRMTRRDDLAMPPLATEEVDRTAADAVGMWIQELRAESCAEGQCDAGT